MRTLSYENKIVQKEIYFCLTDCLGDLAVLASDGADVWKPLEKRLAISTMVNSTSNMLFLHNTHLYIQNLTFKIQAFTKFYLHKAFTDVQISDGKRHYDDDPRFALRS